jgi:protein involved in polysaccharide export with SLBB domain
MSLAGCQALTNPVADGISVWRVPPEFLAESKSELQPISLALLRQRQPDAYRLDTGDILGIWIESILGTANQPPPVTAVEPSLPPAVGYPVPVQANGTIVLPTVRPIQVRGMTLVEAQNAIEQAYSVKQKILLPEKARGVLVTLQRRRHYQVLVVREDTTTSGATTGAGGLFGVSSIGVAAGTSGHGTGVAIDLPAYENDVMNALTRSGGMPGFGAADAVIIERGSSAPRAGLGAPPSPTGLPGSLPETGSKGKIRIPLRVRPGEEPNLRQEDIILQTGDIVSVPSRHDDVFYVGGLLFSGQYQLPRDYDIGVVEAIAITRGSLVNGGLNSLNNLTGSASTGGFGSPNPSLVSVLRRIPNCGQVNIRVDVNKALRDPAENVLIRKNDVLIMQFTPMEAVAKYLTEAFHINLTSTFIRRQDLTGTSTLTVP